MLLFPRGDDTHDLSVSRELTVDPGLTAHTLHARADAQSSYLEDQSVAGNDRSPKTRFFDAGKQDEFLIAILDLTQRQNGSDLGQRFNYQHPGHHRRAGKVALKKILVDTHLLDTDDSFAGDELYDSIDEEKRIAVRQELLNGLCVENCLHHT